MLKRVLPTVLDAIQLIALSLWLGGLFLFLMEGGQSSLHIYIWNTGRYSGLSMAGIQWLMRRRYQHDKVRYAGDAVRQVITIAALLAEESSRTASSSNTAYIVQAVLLAGCAFVTAWLYQPQQTRIPAKQKR